MFAHIFLTVFHLWLHNTFVGLVLKVTATTTLPTDSLWSDFTSAVPVVHQQLSRCLF